MAEEMKQHAALLSLPIHVKCVWAFHYETDGQIDWETRRERERAQPADDAEDKDEEEKKMHKGMLRAGKKNAAKGKREVALRGMNSESERQRWVKREMGKDVWVVAAYILHSLSLSLSPPHRHHHLWCALNF